MACKNLRNLFYCSKYVRNQQNMFMHQRVVLYHCSEDSHEGPLPSDWYEKAFPKLMKLTHLLRNVDLIDGRLVNINDNSIVVDDDHLQQSMHTFKSLVRTFLGSPLVQEALNNHTFAPHLCFSKPNERQSMTVNSLTRVCNFLNISAQQRKSVRLAICPQVTQHQIWVATLVELLTELKSEIELLSHFFPTKGTNIGLQIVSSCLKVLDSTISYDSNSASWMHLGPAKVSDLPDLPVSRKWEDVLEMFNDLTNCLRKEKELLLPHFTKLEDMKEGLLQIKDVLIDKNIGYKEARHQESLVQKKLGKTLGHSSRCLFTLLLYYLYGTVSDIEVEICGGIHESGGGGDKFCLCMGKILTSDEDKMVRSGLKQLDRALGLFKFVWETAGMKGNLELQGHFWCVGTDDSSLTYRGNRFFMHGISL